MPHPQVPAIPPLVSNTHCCAMLFSHLSVRQTLCNAYCFTAMCYATGANLPWGQLTGVRMGIDSRAAHKQLARILWPLVERGTKSQDPWDVFSRTENWKCGLEVVSVFVFVKRCLCKIELFGLCILTLSPLCIWPNWLYTCYMHPTQKLNTSRFDWTKMHINK